MENGKSPISARYSQLDLLRGLLIVLMALDHANFHIARQHSSGEYWGGPLPGFPTGAHFLTRFVTHFSAPGFFFLLGVGMVLFAGSRSDAGWKIGKIRWHFLLRGLVLIGLQAFLNYSQAWAIGGKPALQLYLGVLAALGAAMILCIPLLRMHPAILGIISLGLFLALEFLTPQAALWGLNFDQLAGTMLVFSGGRGEFWSNYPLLAWLEVAVFGLAYGRWLESRGKQVYQKGIGLGLVFLLGFVLLRAWNGFGTIRPIPIRDWSSFLTVVKYPPSMAFTLLTMGVNLIVLGLLDRTAGGFRSPGNPLLVFGRVPLFFYLAHIYLYKYIGKVIAPGGSSLGMMFVFWLAGLAALYYPALWYGKFKSRQPLDSWVRYF